jgi:hypothetical protein
MPYVIRSTGCQWVDQSEGYVLKAGESFSDVPFLPQESAHDVLIGQAKAALISTDMVSLRCFKAGVIFPTDWQTYVTALRAITNGLDTVSIRLPTPPAYPAGT